MLIRLLSCVLVWWIVIDPTAAQESPTAPHVSALTSQLAVAPTVVRVQLDLTIANPSREEREHVLDLRVPEAAAVDRFGLWVQGRYLEGEIAPRALGRRLYREVSGIDDATRVKRDPALLTWEGPGHLRLRVFPVPPEGSARLRLSYVVLRPLRGELAIPAVLAAEAPRSPAIADTAQIIPALPPPADEVRVHAFSARAGEPGYFLAVIPITAWEQQRPVLKPDLELILRDTSRRMAGRYAPGSSLQRELASRLAVAHPVFLLDADVVPHPVVALDARTAGSEPTCGGTFDLAAALHAAEVFLTAHPGKQVHLTVLGDAEQDCGAALAAAPVLPQVPGGQVRLVCVGSPSWVRAFAPALIDERAFTDVQLSGVDGVVDGVSDLGPAWLPRAVPGEHLLMFGRHHGERGTIRIRQRAPDGSSLGQSIALTFQPDPDAAWLPRLWADARVRDLAHATGDPTVAAERERQQQDLARRYQVLAPASSFVVLSNERDYRANALERTARLSGWAEQGSREVISEPPADPWRTSSRQGFSLFSIQSEPTTVGVDREAVWSMATSPHGEDSNRDEYLHRYLHRDEYGRWNDGRWIAGLETPAGSWASPIPSVDLTSVPPAVVARWGRQVPPVIAGFAGERWCWWREGEQAVLQHLTADGTSDWSVVIDQDGIRTALPDWGVWWRHQPDQRLVDSLLELAPSPTWLPLSWLSRFAHITAEARGDALHVALFPRSPGQDVPPTMTVRGFLLPASGEVAQVHWATQTYNNRDHRLVLTQHGERIMIRAAEGDEWDLTWQPAPSHPRELPLPIDRPVIGVMEAAPLWRRLHTGGATAADCWQMALAAPQVAESLPWLERAHELAPQDAGIILHLTVALGECGHHARVPALLAHLAALDLPAWQLPGVRRLQRELTDLEPDPADVPAKRPRLEWPQVWRLPQQPYEEETALMQQIVDAVKQEQPERLVELLCQSTSGRVYYHGVSGTTPLTVMQAVFGDETRSPRWQAPAARQVLSRLAQDPRGRAFFRESLRNGGSEVIHAHLRDVLRDPVQVDLARLTLSPYYGKGNTPRRFSRSELLAFAGDSYPPVVRALAWVRLMKDHTWSIDDRAAAEAELRRRLAAITQPDLRLRVMGDCLDLLAPSADERWSRLPSAVAHPVLPNLYDDVGAVWDTALATHTAISDPLAHAAGQADLQRVLEHVVSGVVVTHRHTDLAALLTRLEALSSSAICRPAFGHLRPLVVQLCRQAVVAGLREEAVTTAAAVFADAPEPGLLPALTHALPHDLVLLNLGYPRSFEEGVDVYTAPQAWWPEWQEDAAALVRRCRSGVRQPDARTSHVIRERGLSRAVVAAAAAELQQQGPDLQWLAFTAPVDADGARQVLAALPAMRQALGMPTHAAYAALRLAFRHGLLAEAQGDLAALRAIAPRPADLAALQVAIAALDGDGSTALTHVRAWIAARMPRDDISEIYARSVDLLCATRRYQDAFVLRQEALAFHEAARTGKMPESRHWHELFSSQHQVLDQVVVPEGTVLFPHGWNPSGGFQLDGADEPAADPAAVALAAQVALGRYPAIAAEAAAGFAQADAARRFAWFGALWITPEQRLGADCPPLVAWLRELVTQRAPLPAQHVVAILQVVAPASADAWVAYVHQARAMGLTDVPNLLWRSRQVAEGTMDVPALLALIDIDGKGLPDRDWIWKLKEEEPPAFTARLTEIALQRVRDSLTGTANGNRVLSTDADRAWVAKHPEVRARIDALADALLAERPDDLKLCARCAGLGLGTRPADVLWRRLVAAPLDAVEAMRGGELDDEIGSGCLRVLIAEGRWDDLVTFLRRCERAGVSFSMKGVPERSKLTVMAQYDGAVAAANALAAMTRNSDWLISAGYPDPSTHPDWDSYRELTWTLRGDLERLEAHAQQVFDDPFATWERQEYAYTQIIAVLLWRREYQNAVWMVAALAGEDSPLGGPSPRDAAYARRLRESTGGFSGPWGDIEQLLCDDWITTIDPRSPTREEQADARAEQMLARRLGFLHHCAHAPVDAIPTSALLMSLDVLRNQGYLPIDRTAPVMADLARVLRRCIDRGLQERLRELLRDGGPLPWPEPATVEAYPAFIDLWLLRARITGEPLWPYGDHRESAEAWRGLPPSVQRDLLRQVSDLARLPGAEPWWPRWREDSNLRELIPELMPVPPSDPTDPADVPATPVPDPWLGQIPPPEVWLAREAWWRTGGAARTPEQ